jgi:hypothetical protein
MKANLATGAFLAVALHLCTAGTAQAQEREVAIGDRIDRRIERDAERELDEAVARAGRTGGPATAFTFSLSTPGYWANNVDYADTGGRSDFHINPTADFAVRHDTGNGLVIDAAVTASTDQYLEHEDVNGSFLGLRLQASLKNGIGNFTPFVRYQPRLSYDDGDFGGDSATTHNFTLGGSMPLGSSTRVKSKLNVSATRREASNASAERWQTGATLTFSGDITPNRLGWSLSQGLEGRFFDGGANDGREDIYSLTSAGLTIPITKQLELTPVELSLEWNESNRLNRDYLVLSVGIGLSISFSTP